MLDLEKVDALRKRFAVTYEQAKDALEECGGDLVETLVYLEKKGYAYADGQEGAAGDDEGAKWDKEKAGDFVRGLIEQIKTIIREGNVTKVRLVNGDSTLIEIPATVGVVGLGIILFSPLMIIVTALSATAAIFKKMVIEVEKADGTVERHELAFQGFWDKKDDADEPCCDEDDCCCEEDEEDCCSEEE